MLGWNDIVQKYIAKHANRIQKVTEPLRVHFGIGYFTYHHIDHEGKYTVLVDRPDWAEHYVGNKIYLNDPYLRHPSNYNSGFCLFDSQGSDEYKKTVTRSGKAVLDMDIGVALIRKAIDGAEFFGFAGNKRNSALEKLYLNDPELLSAFGEHFKRELHSILLKMNSEAGLLSELKGSDFFLKEPVHPDIPLTTRGQYLKDIGMKRELKLAAMLSQRERECLQLLLQNKTAKETASSLGLSKRTVESYLENIKNKLQCWNKQEVLAIAITLRSYGLL